MIKFFRRIRQQLVSQNNVSKYLLYAIGEIALVVIGILIALQINNNNQDHLERVEEESYLLRIEKDIQQDTSYIKEKIKEDLKYRDSFTKFLREIYKEQKSHSEFLSLLQLGNWDVRSLYLVDFTFKEITSSGKFEIIQSIELKESILDYYRHRDFGSAHLAQTTEFGFNNLAKVFPSLSRHYNYDILNELDVYTDVDWNWINNPSSDKFKYLEASISHFRYKSIISEAYFQQALVKANNILKLLETITHD